MPLFIDLSKNDLLMEEREIGRREGDVNLLRLLIAKRFGSVPAWLDTWLSERTASELEDVALRFVDAQTLEDLVK